MRNFGCLILILLVAIAGCGGCADSKTFENGGVPFVAEPYGPANETARKIDGVVYEVSAGNVVLSIIFCETLFVPVWLVGWDLYEPVKYVAPIGVAVPIDSTSRPFIQTK